LIYSDLADIQKMNKGVQEGQKEEEKELG